MPRWLWILLTIIISSGIYLSVRYGLRPKPIAMINPTVIGQPIEMGPLIYNRIYEAIRTEKILFFGYSDVKIFSNPFVGFIKAARANGMNFKTIIEVSDSKRPNQLSTTLALELAVNWISVGPEDLLPILKQQMAKHEVVGVVVPVEQGTHLERSGLIKQVEAELKSPIMAINFLPFYVTENELERQSLDCSKSKDEMNTKEKLDCASLKISRKFLRKKLDELKYYVALEWHGLKEYLAYIHTPVFAKTEEIQQENK